MKQDAIEIPHGCTYLSHPHPYSYNTDSSARLCCPYRAKTPHGDAGPPFFNRHLHFFAKILKLRLWYDWLPGRHCPLHTEKITPEQLDVQKRSDYVTNQELLDKKGMATVMFCLDALQLFENMDEEEVRQVSQEIAVIGMDGLDYASSDQKYTLQSIPGRKFSGLHLMALMYVGFKQIAPDRDTGIPFESEYRQALVFHRRKP
jgi:hypothetical protein